MKNLLLLINQMHGGGAQKVIANLSMDLQTQYNIFVAYYNDLDKVVFLSGGKLLKIELPYSADTHHNNLFKRVYRSGSLIRKLRRLKKEYKIDVSISFMEASNFVNILSKRREKTILSVRSFLSNEFVEHKRLRIFSGFIKALYQKGSYIITPAELIKQDLVDNFRVPKDRIRVIPNYINLKVAEEKKNLEIEPAIEHWMTGHKVIINVGRITPAKSQWVLPDVLKIVQKRVPEARLLIIGEGISLNKVLKAAKAAGLKAATDLDDLGSGDCDICIPGFKENPYAYMRDAKIFIKSSIYEGFPNVIIEAMATGLPIISSDCASGPREILAPDTDQMHLATTLEHASFGLLAPAPDDGEEKKAAYVSAASAAVIELLTDQTKYKYYQERSSLRASQYSKEKILLEWISVIEN